jgi:hypothetical protein
MKYFNNYADNRVNGQCLYCGDFPDTNEHVPPKVFLDAPFPENLPVVESCVKCNQSFSLDEQYMACLLDCVISETTNPDEVYRETVKKTLKAKPALAQRLKDARKTIDGKEYFSVESERIYNVVKKIAIGHVLYELNLIMQADEAEISILPWIMLDDHQQREFEEFHKSSSDLWPEFGSRSMQRILSDAVYENRWIEVQPGRYRYAVIQTDIVEIRMVFSEYLACIVRWLN